MLTARDAIRVFGLLTVLAASAFLVACNTVEGVGEDAQAAGAAVEDAANDAK